MFWTKAVQGRAARMLHATHFLTKFGFAGGAEGGHSHGVRSRVRHLRARRLHHQPDIRAARKYVALHCTALHCVRAGGDLPAISLSFHFRALICNALSSRNIQRRQERLMNWKEFARRGSLPKRGTIPEFAWKD
jgi:hypothetical protein